MIAFRVRGFSWMLALATIPWVGSACSSDKHTEPQAATGTLSLPLVTTTNGHTYRLSGAIYTYGASYQYIYLNGESTEVKRTLPAGAYWSYLYYYELERLDEESGKYLPVSARLLTDGDQRFTIYDRTTTTLTYQFETDGVIVTVGSGNLSVQIGVTEVDPVCTILGNDCDGGLWCAPPELTGRPLACIDAGDVDVGDACNGPTECEANSSCYDFGQGPVCTALCSASELGKACTGGGTCTKVGTAYGICVPEGGTLPGGGGAGGEGNGGSSGFGGQAGD